MAELTAAIVQDVIKVCQAGAEEAAGAIGRAFDVQLTITVGEPITLEPDQLPDDLNDSGLAIVEICGTSGAVFCIADATGFVPVWCDAPDPTGQSKLTTLAQEIGMILLPEDFMPDDFKAGKVKNLNGAIRRGGLAAGAACIPFELTSADGQKGIARLIWPVAKPAVIVGAAPEPKAEPKAEAKVEAKPAPKPEAKPAAAAAAKPASQERPRSTVVRSSGPRELPNYSKSLLKIKVPVVVSLAEKKQAMGRIVEMGPGLIIQFDKSCEEMLELEVGDCKIAMGEAIKVGDKFGLRVTSIKMPEERFTTVRPGV